MFAHMRVNSVLQTDQFKVATAIVRIDSRGPYLHENDAHALIGVESVKVNGEYLEIKLSNSNPVASVIISPDETVGGERGIIAGGSGGVSNVKIALFDTKIGRRLNMSNSSDYRRAAGVYSNLWVTVIHYVG